jgi:F-type H+-transporting ATPase subunit gamma
MANTKEVKRRIKLVKTTSQITRAMELVAATKMRKAETDAKGTRPYSDHARKILRSLVGRAEKKDSPFLRTNEKGKILALVITPDRGLCGSLSTNVLRETNALLSKFPKEEAKEEIDVMAIGKRGADVLRRQGYNIIAAATRLDWKPRVFDIRSFAKIALDGYETEKYKKVYLVFSNFISSSRQKPMMRTLLPFSSEGSEEMAKVVGTEENQESKIKNQEKNYSYLIEPSAEIVLPIIIRNLVEMEIFQALLESNASEHSARMLAMHSATENAQDLMDDLSLSYNRIRQESITRELAEISASAT